MATTEEIRAWLAGNGYDVPDRGRIREDLRQAYDAAHASPGTAEDDDGGISAADFEEEPSAVTPETRPARPRAGRTRARKAGGILSGLLSSKGGSGKQGTRKKTPRTGLDKLITRLYARGGQMMAAVAPATGRCLQAQSAMAGIILEDIAKDTIVDRILQPVARAEDKLDKVFALTAPPVLVLALETTDPDNAMRRMLLTQLLRESLLISMDITDAYASQIEETVRKNAENEKRVDDLLKFIFNVPTAETEQPEPEMAGAAA